MFDQMIEEIQEEAVWMLYRVQLAAPLQRQAVAVANETPDGQGRQYRNRPRPESGT